MEYLSLIFSLVSILILYKLKNENIIPFSLIVIFGSLGILFISNLINKYSLTSDQEFNSSIVSNARYYEYWETWVEETCTRQVPCGQTCTTSNGSTSCTTNYCTETYDCSYCDHNNDYYEAIDEINNSYSIDKIEYDFLRKKWGSDIKFVELNRKINHYGGCGVDGNAYQINWDKNIHKTETYNWIKNFTNRTRLNKSAFNYNLTISDSEAVSMGLYKYPKIKNDYKQEYLLGFDKIKHKYNNATVDSIESSFKYLNGSLGVNNKVHVFVLLFMNKPQDISIKQEIHWEGGNQNEIVVCIGLNNKNNTLKTEWVKSFSWTDNKKTLIDIRENIMELDSIDFFKCNKIISDAIIKDKYHYKNLDKDFDYLDIDLSDNTIILDFILVFLFNLIALFIAIKIEI